MSVASKLKLTEGKLVLLQAPADCFPLFEAYIKSVKLIGKQVIEQVVLFAADKKALDASFVKAAPQLAEDALLWIAYPKKSGKIKTDISRDNGWESVFAAGYDPVMQVAIDDNWSALRFRKTEDIGPKLRDIPMKDRKTEGVDYVKKTVALPVDAEKALKKYKGLADFFYGMAFSHKKEYAEAIAGAKKEETRIRRIEKMVEALLEMKTAKEQKKKNQ